MRCQLDALQLVNFAVSVKAQQYIQGSMAPVLKGMVESQEIGTERVDKMSRQLEKSIEGLITIFHSYSSKEGDKHKLSKAELKTLLQEELTDFMAGCSDAAAVDKIMTDLDENGDQQLDFQEFVVLVAALTVACNEFFEGSCKN